MEDVITLIIKENSSIPEICPIVRNELDHITAAVKAHTTPESIYLFGSYVNGAPDCDSDTDPSY